MAQLKSGSTVDGSSILSAGNASIVAADISDNTITSAKLANNTIQSGKLATDINGYGTRTVSTAAPSGGSDGDVWYKY